jgi:hypothetical protein
VSLLLFGLIVWDRLFQQPSEQTVRGLNIHQLSTLERHRVLGG